MSGHLPTVLFVDLQEGGLGLVRTRTDVEVRPGARALAKSARLLSVPVVASGIDAAGPPFLTTLQGGGQ